MKTNQHKTMRLWAPVAAAAILLSGCAAPSEEPTALPAAAVAAAEIAPSKQGPAPVEMLAEADHKATVEAARKAAAEQTAERAEKVSRAAEKAQAAEAERKAAEAAAAAQTTPQTAPQTVPPEPAPAPVEPAPAPVVSQAMSWYVPVAGAGGQEAVDACYGPIHFTPLSGYGVYIAEHDSCGGWARFSGMNVGEAVTVAGFGSYTVQGIGTVPRGGTTNDVIGQFGFHPAVVLQTCIPGTNSMRVIALG